MSLYCSFVLMLFSVVAVKGGAKALPYYFEDSPWTHNSPTSSNIPIFDTTPFKNSASADEGVQNNVRRSFQRPQVASYQVTARDRIRPIYYPLPSVAGVQNHGRTVVILFHGEEEVDTSLI